MLQAAERHVTDRHVTDRDVGPNSLWGPVIDGPDLEVMLVGAKTGFDFPELVIPGNNILSIQIVCTMNQNGVKAVTPIKGNWHLDETIQSKIMAMVFSMAAEIERGLISARTKEALRARRASGLPVGRPKGPGKSKLDKHRPEIEALLANGSTQKFIAKRYNSSPANLANWLKKRGIKKPKL